MKDTKEGSSDNGGWSLVPHEEIESILQVLSKSLPASLQIYNFINCCLLWTSSYPHVKSEIFHKLNKGVNAIIATLKTHELIVTAYSSNGLDLDIAPAISGNYIINWSEENVLLSCMPAILYPSIKEAMILEDKEIKLHKAFNSFWLPADAARAFDVQCPEDMYLAKLEPKHAEIVARHWPYARRETLNILAQMINVTDTVGMFTKKDSTLVSWVLNTFYGVGMLHTLEEFRRKGYGNIVVQQIVKSLGDKGINAYTSTLSDNHAAESLFKNIGFKKLEEVMFMKAV